VVLGPYATLMIQMSSITEVEVLMQKRFQP
jgi:hypothetical protein